MTAVYKVFTHDLRSPLHGGEPVWDGSLPYRLPVVAVDRSEEACGVGWNFCAEPHTALSCAGLWPDGRPSRLFLCEISEDHVVRGNKIRAATGQIVSEVTDFRPLLVRLYGSFGDIAGELEAETVLWREALARPNRDDGAVEACLREALRARGLDWELKRFGTVAAVRSAGVEWDARAARAAWSDEAWKTAWEAWAGAASAAWEASDALTAWAAREGWEAWAGAASAAWEAREALTVWVAGKKGWTQQDPNLLTAGIRDAYRSGLGIATPVDGNTVGWAMEEVENARLLRRIHVLEEDLRRAKRESGMLVEAAFLADARASVLAESLRESLAYTACAERAHVMPPPWMPLVARERAERALGDALGPL